MAEKYIQLMVSSKDPFMTPTNGSYPLHLQTYRAMDIHPRHIPLQVTIILAGLTGLTTHVSRTSLIVFS
jgi:hypothetical protein